MNNKQLTILVIVILIAIGADRGTKEYYYRSTKSKVDKLWDSWGHGAAGQRLPPDEPIESPQKQPAIDPTSWKEALQRATVFNKKIFLYFENENCTWCKKMKETTFRDETVRVALENYIIFFANVSDEKKLADEFKVTGIPAYYIVDHKGNIYSKARGYMKKDEFLKWLMK